MGVILNIVYLLVILLASPWLVYCAARKGKYREGFGEKLFGLVPKLEPDGKETRV